MDETYRGHDGAAEPDRPAQPGPGYAPGSTATFRYTAPPPGPYAQYAQYGAGQYPGQYGAGQYGAGQPGWPPPPLWPPQQPYWPPPPPRRGLPGWAIAVLAFGLVVLLFGGITVAVAIQHAARGSGPSASGWSGPQGGYGAPAAPAPANPGNADAAAIAAKVNPAVVDVNTILGYQNGRAAGTGVVLSSSGLVLTNNHVVAGATSISVTDVGDGQTYQAAVVGYDRSEDIAVVQLKDASGLATASIGDSSKVRVGDSIVAIGNAGGTGGTPAAAPGTVTGLNRSITASDEGNGTSETLRGLIEVNANVVSGDSGGPLVNTSGQVIGIDTAASAGFQYQNGQDQTGGDGFAIPINQAMTIAKQIQAGTASSTVHIGQTAFLGVQTRAGRDAQQTVAGAPVAGVLSGSPAEAAGLARGDVIQSLNGKAVDSATTLTTLLDAQHPGDRVSVGWVDVNGQSHTATVTLVAGPVG
jgi:S1-C subfamily serine protease